MKKVILFIFFPCFFFGQKEIPFTFKNYCNLVNYFTDLKEVRSFFNFKNGEMIADIGAGTGKYTAIYALFTDSCIFYAEDIDTKNLNNKSYNKYIEHYSKLKDQPQTNTFKLCTGTFTSTNLPDTAFDKIIILSAIHEFTQMDDMIADIYTKLKPGGRLYVIDAECTMEGHVNYKPEAVSEKIIRHNFTCISLENGERNGGKYYKGVFIKK